MLAALQRPIKLLHLLVDCMEFSGAAKRVVDASIVDADADTNNDD